MHILSDYYRSEFLATPELVRFEHAQGKNGFEPTLLIKSSTLLLKYIVQGADIHLGFSMLEDRLLYAVKVSDDPESPRILWSIAEHEAELAGLNALVDGDSLQVFLFNELAVNVAWASLSVAAGNDLKQMITLAAIGQDDHGLLEGAASSVLDHWVDRPVSDPDVLTIAVPKAGAWNRLHNSYVTSHATGSSLDLFASNEGDHQEQLAVWLTDSLHPWAAHHSPSVLEDKKGLRELTDVLLSYEKGSICIESKALSILGRAPLPSRAKLGRRVGQVIQKGIGQLRGGIRNLKDGAPVTSQSGIVLDVERTQPVHGIVLIPELTLIENREAYGTDVIRSFARATGGFLHILDIAELLRIVQAAEMIATRNTNVTKMMAFDFYLLERHKIAMEAGTLCVQVILRFEDR